MISTSRGAEGSISEHIRSQFSTPTKRYSEYIVRKQRRQYAPGAKRRGSKNAMSGRTPEGSIPESTNAVLLSLITREKE